MSSFDLSKLRGLFTAARAMIFPTPDADMAYMRHPELGTAEDEASWRSDVDYLKALAQSIYDELADGAFLWEMPIEVWSDKLFEDVA